jgi:hypothetical protein
LLAIPIPLFSGGCGIPACGWGGARHMAVAAGGVGGSGSALFRRAVKGRCAHAITFAQTLKVEQIATPYVGAAGLAKEWSLGRWSYVSDAATARVVSCCGAGNRAVLIDLGTVSAKIREKLARSGGCRQS